MRIFVLSLLSVLFMTAATAAETPRPSPELTMKRFQGQPFHLSQFRGKVVALAFIHTSCNHCQDLTRLLVPIQKEYQARNVVVVECAFNEDAELTMGPFFKIFQPNFPVGFTTDAAVKAYLKWDDRKDGILMIPHMVFINAKGTITADHGENDFFGAASDKNIRGVLDKMTSQAAPPAAKKK
jgi:thiol-disulfide isomerase/thioredoxin